METTNNQMTQRRMSVIRWVSILCILAALLTIVRSLSFDQAMSAAKGWIEGLGFWGPVVLVLPYIVATILFVPGTILTLAAGAMFGLGVGTAAVSFGSTIDASLNEQVDESSESDEAAVLVSSATYVCLHAGQIERSLTSLFGPPPVKMQEAYAANPSGPKIDHTALNELLKKHVDVDGWVDYGSLKSDKSKLDAYLTSIANVPFDELGRDEKLTLLINGYNAATLRLILDHMPLASIMDIPEADCWDAVRWNIGGNTWKLNSLENKQTR